MIAARTKGLAANMKVENQGSFWCKHIKSKLELPKQKNPPLIYAYSGILLKLENRETERERMM